MAKRCQSRKSFHAAKGYGLTMLMTFIASMVMIATSLQLVAVPVGLAYLGASSQNALSARNIAEIGISDAEADIQSRLNSLQTVDTSYSLSNSVSMPGNPASPSTLNASVESYTASLSYARGNVYILNVIGTVNSASAQLSKVLNLGISHEQPLDYISGATAAYGLRKLRSAYSGSAIRVRRPSDNTEQDIGFNANGDLDLVSLQSFLGTTLPLNIVSSAEAAYSLRRIRSAYTGSAIRVRRSNDNSEMDIGFTSSGDLDIATLMEFVGTNSGFIRYWYDQSGNADNASQTDATKQPMIVSSGILQMVDSGPEIRFDGTNDELTLPVVVYNDMSILATYNAVTGRGPDDWYAYDHGRIIDSDKPLDANDFTVGISTSGLVTGNVGRLGYLDLTTYAPAPATPGDSRMHWLAFTREKSSSVFTIYSDRGSYSKTNGNTGSLNAHTQISIGGSVNQFNGYIGEVFFYGSVLSETNRLALQREQASYWNIPMKAQVDLPLDTVTNAAAAYGLRKLRAGYTGSAIRVRRSPGTTEKDIGFVNNTDLDVADLLNFVGNNSAYVVTWYNQSGNGTSTRNASQPTAANQPRIVNAGTLEMLNGRPALYFEEATSHMALGTEITGIGNYSAFAITQTSEPTTANFLVSGKADNRQLLRLDVNGSGVVSILSFDGNGNATGVSYPATQSGSVGIIRTGSSSMSYSNGIAQTMSPTRNGTMQFGRIGGLGTPVSPALAGWVSEVILYTTNLSNPDAETFQRNLNQYYSPPNQSAYVTKWYDQSGNGNNAVETNPLLQPVLSFGSDGGHSGVPTLLFEGDFANTGNRLVSSAGFPTASNYSVSAVFSYRNASTMNIVVGSSEFTNAHSLYLSSTNNLRLWHGSNFATSSTAMTPNTQYAVLGTYVNSSRAGVLYQRNISVGSSTAATTTSEASIQLGSIDTPNINMLNGTISEVIVFNKVLSTSERTALYTSQQSTYGAQ